MDNSSLSSVFVMPPKAFVTRISSYPDNEEIGYIDIVFDTNQGVRDYFNKYCHFNEDLMERDKNKGEGYISNSEEDIRYIVNLKPKHQTKFSTILEPFEECENFDKYISYLDSVRLKSLQQANTKIDQKIIERDNNDDYLLIRSILSDAVTQHKGCGREIKNDQELKSFRLKNKKFSLTFNGIILDKTQIVQYFEVNKSARPKGLTEGMNDYVVAHEYGQNNKHTHIMFNFETKIDSSNPKNLSVSCLYKGKLETFEPVVHAQSSSVERGTMLRVFHRIDKNVFYSYPTRYAIEKYKYNPDTLMTNLTCETSFNVQNMEISTNSSVSTSSTPISFNSTPISFNSFLMSSCQSNSLQSTSLELTLSKFKMPIFNTHWQNDLMKELEQNNSLKNVCYYPNSENDDLDNKISEIIVHLQSCSDKKKYYVTTLYQNREKFFDGIIKDIKSKEWNGNTLFVYFNHDDYSSDSYEELYKNLFKDLKKIKTRVITTLECQKPTVLSQSPNIILIITKKMQKIGSESEWIYREIN